MTEFKTVAVIGGSGNLGQGVVKALLENGFEVTAINRKESTATFPEKVRLVKVDFTLEELTSALSGHDVLVTLLNAPGYEQQMNITKAAVAAKMKRILPNEYGTHRENTLPLFKKNLATKTEALEYIKKAAAEDENITWTGILTGPIWEYLLEHKTPSHGVFGNSFKFNTMEIFDSGDVPFIVTTYKGVAAAVVGVLKHPDETKNKMLTVHSFKTTQNEIHAALEDITGETWPVTRMSAEVAYKLGMREVERASFWGVRRVWALEIFNDKRHGGLVSDHYDNDLLQVPQEDLKEALLPMAATFPWIPLKGKSA